ncbi:MAG: 4-(cytidine 5'-diphospho)-2-C-methyl-D-erythritol kinase [Alphaproteobacteria bacterium]
MHTITMFAPAKINLYLHVTGRREDGYHLLDSLVAFADIGDRIAVEAADRFEFALTGPMAASLAGENPEGNLAVRAAKTLALAAKKPLNFKITLEKNLPIASGIGGGSTDAAAALLALARFWNLRPETLPLHEIARGLGQDIPACLLRRPCYFRNIGDELDPAPNLPRTGIVLANPGLSVPTPAVFKRRQGDFSPPARLEPAATLQDLIAALKTRRNDLYAPAIELAPAIADCLNAVAATQDCLLARMSGSGATCFGLYETAALAGAAAAALQKQHPDWWVQSGVVPFADS